MRWVAWGLVLALSGPAWASDECLSYGVPVTLTGRITVGATYGEQLRTGRTGWTRWRQITLDRPVCTKADPADPFAAAERDVRAIQPVWVCEDLSRLRVGEAVTVSGKLFHADNGAQMTPVLIDVTRLTPSR